MPRPAELHRHGRQLSVRRVGGAARAVPARPARRFRSRHQVLQGAATEARHPGHRQQPQGHGRLPRGQPEAAEDRPDGPLLGALRRRRDAGRGDRARLRHLVRAGKILYAGLYDSRPGASRGRRRLRSCAARRRSPGSRSSTAWWSARRSRTAADGAGARPGIVAWSPLGGGMLTGKYRRGEAGRAQGLGGRVFQPENSAQRTAVLDTVIAVAEETGTTPAQVAIAWVAGQGRAADHRPAHDPAARRQSGRNQLKLTTEQIARLDEASAIPPVFPYTLIEQPGIPPARDRRQARSARSSPRAGRLKSSANDVVIAGRCARPPHAGP